LIGLIDMIDRSISTIALDMDVIKIYTLFYIVYGKRIEHSFLQTQLPIAPHQKYWTELSIQEQDNAMLEYGGMYTIN